MQTNLKTTGQRIAVAEEARQQYGTIEAAGLLGCIAYLGVRGMW